MLVNHDTINAFGNPIEPCRHVWQYYLAIAKQRLADNYYSESQYWRERADREYSKCTGKLDWVS